MAPAPSLTMVLNPFLDMVKETICTFMYLSVYVQGMFVLWSSALKVYLCVPPPLSLGSPALN